MPNISTYLSDRIIPKALFKKDRTFPQLIVVYACVALKIFSVKISLSYLTSV